MRTGLFLIAVLLLAGCSEVVDVVVQQDSPGFSLTVAVETNVIRLSWPEAALGLTVPPPDSDDNEWTVLYGYYVMRSYESPYSGYALAARLLNPVTVDTWVEQSWNGNGYTYTDVDLVPVDSTGYIGLDTLQYATQWTDSVTNRPVFYRVAVLSLEKSVDSVSDEDSNETRYDISYELDQAAVSGWVAVQ